MHLVGCQRVGHGCGSAGIVGKLSVRAAYRQEKLCAHARSRDAQPTQALASTALYRKTAWICAQPAGVCLHTKDVHEKPYLYLVQPGFRQLSCELKVGGVPVQSLHEKKARLSGLCDPRRTVFV